MKFYVVLIFFIVYVAESDSGLPFQRPPSPNVENQGLYDDNDKAVVVTAQNLDSVVMRKNHGTLLQFYNSFCGHCRRFAPKYKQLAETLYPWRDILVVAAIDCSTDENYDVCRQYEILAYPTLRYFEPHYVSGDKNFGTPVISQDLDEIADVLARNIIAQSHSEPQWPDFSLLDDSSSQALFKNEPSNLKYVVIVFESENSTIGAQTILNFSRIKQIKIRRTTNVQAAKKMGIETFNTIKVFQRGTDSMSISVPNASPASFKRVIELFLKDKGITADDHDVTNAATALTNVENDLFFQVLKIPRQTVFQADLEQALRYTLFHEIPSVKNITGEKLLAMQKYLGVLSRYNLLGENGRRFVDDLKNFAYSHNQDLDGWKFQQKALELEKLYSPMFSSSKWVGCIASKPKFRGYTCGLWTLFHSLTVQATEDDAAVDPVEVLGAIHGFVKSFFGCTDCSQHFQQMAARRKIWEVASKDEAVLWLWEAHNEVNARLKGDATEDPDFPKVQFPTFESCPSCYRENSRPPTQNSTPNWDKFEVLRFLKQIHSPYNVSRFGVSDESVLPEAPAKMRSKRMIYSVFSDIDMRMGILLYIFCVGMMFLAVKLFLRKGYRKKPYIHGMLGKV